MSRPLHPAFWAMAQLGSRVRLTPRALRRLPHARGAAPTAVVVPTRHGPVRALVLQPRPGPGPVPVVLHLHGGGFVNRYPEQDLPLARHLVAELGVGVVLPDYGTAPRVRYPVPEQQVADVAQWICERAAERGWDPEQLVVSGISAGAKLAVGTCQERHARGLPRPAAACLTVPVLDLTRADRTSPARRPAISPFVQRFAQWAHVPDPARRAEPLASPALDEHLADAMPPTLVLTAELDTLAGDGAHLARTLTAGGVPVEHHEVAGADHGMYSDDHALGLLRTTTDFLARHLPGAAAPGDERGHHPGR